MKIPENYLPVMPYIILYDTKGFLAYMKTVFGATEQFIVPGDEGRAIIHGEVRIHDAVIMFGGSNDQWTEKTCGMFLYVEDVDRIYNTALENGSRPLTEPTQQDYGYSGGFQDPFGNQWWIAQGEKE